ncbi:MAG: efflux RND transporter periplasmic adaptor subunit [Polaromonas sp.]|nr:efflux RND transporter periplasmic adaptor subunit [Polaromonas sp.]
MPDRPQAAPEASLDARALIEQLHLVRKASLSEVDWQRYCQLMRQLCRASHCAVLRKVEAGASLQMLGCASDKPDWSPLDAMPPGIDLLTKAQTSAYAQTSATSPDGQSWLVLVLALQGVAESFLILNIKQQERAQFNELTLRALLAIDFERATQVASPALASDELSGMLGLAAQVMQQPGFESACLTLVNGISAEWALAHASLGWIDDGRPQVVAISHLDRFERNSRQSQLIEAALSTALNQGHEVWWNAEHGDAPDSQELGDFARDASIGRCVAIPVRDAHGQTHAVLLLGFSASASEPDLNHLLLSLELIEPRLRDLRLRSLGWTQRAKHQLRSLSERVFGPEHAVLKAVATVALLALLYVLLGSWNYRVDANAQLNTESTRLISAQFDGRIDQVYATAGDLVKAGSLLVALDTRELEQQQSELNAEAAKAETEVNKNRADGRLADTEIAQARLDQSLAKSQRVEAYLKSAKSAAPFEGVIVEGERKDLLGAPVKKGDKIFKIAKIEGLYVTLMVAERQMRYVQPGASGEVALLSHADHNIPVRINSVIPVAQVKGQEGNQFMITAELLEPPQPWWRPGMTGLARIDVGQRSILWILTHRLLDNLRLLLWW